MICLVLALNLDLKMSSKLNSICDSDHFDSPPSILYGAGVFDNLRELSEESMAPKEICDINKTYNGFKPVRVIEPPFINCWKKGVPCVESATARSTRCQFCNLGKQNCSQANHNFPENPRRFWSSTKKGGIFGLEAPVDEPPTSDATSGHSNCEFIDQGIGELLTSVISFSSALVTGSRMRGVQQWTNTSSSWANTGGPIHPQGNPIGVSPEIPIFVTRKDGRLGKLKRNLVVQNGNDIDAEGSDELDGEELEITTPIQNRRIQSTSLFPVQASTTTNEVIWPPQPPQLPNRSPIRPSTLSSTSTNLQPPVASTSRNPMSPEPESIFDNHCHWNITGNFNDQKKVKKKVVTSLFDEVYALTEVFVDKAKKSAIPGEPTISLAQEAVAYEDALVVKLKEALKFF
ncbi:hypothetical protein O181_117246 [Austropuccinia psidii MF-1]|uniref:Uncharacterized protein n=1 Tax=Austropuccinia psidii MF-1 TaxID=1389203 RepID=A0A9Q3KBJ7_9BASI|nr:hypothetical protein [Austropuccinia psidii MF-1]